MAFKHISECFGHIRARLEEIEGKWDGEFPGPDEDRAHTASDAIPVLDELESAVKFLEIE